MPFDVETTYGLRIITADEQVFVHQVENVLMLSELIPLFGNGMNKVANIAVVAQTPNGEIIIHQERFL